MPAAHPAPVANCRHCGDPVAAGLSCPLCLASLRNECAECHQELAHDEVLPRTVHLTPEGRSRPEDETPEQQNALRAMEEAEEREEETGA
jgi:hypothetical protein